MTRHTAKNSGLLPRNLRVSSRISGRCILSHKQGTIETQPRSEDPVSHQPAQRFGLVFPEAALTIATMPTRIASGLGW